MSYDCLKFVVVYIRLVVLKLELDQMKNNVFSAFDNNTRSMVIASTGRQCDSKFVVNRHNTGFLYIQNDTNGTIISIISIKSCK